MLEPVERAPRPTREHRAKRPTASADPVPERVVDAARHPPAHEVVESARTPFDHVRVLQRSAGNAAVSRALADPATTPVVSRQPAPAPPRRSVDLGWMEAVNNQQLAAAGRYLVAVLHSDMADLDGASKAWGRADEWIHDINPWLPYLDSKASEAIEASVAAYTARKLQEYGSIRADIQEERLIPLRKAWWQAQREAEQAAAQAEAIPGQMDDALRAAFRKGSSATVKDVVQAGKSALSIGRNLRQLAYDMSKELLKLDLPKNTTIYRIPTNPLKPVSIELVAVTKYTDKLTTLNRGLNVVSIVLTIADRSKRATHTDQAMKDLNDVVSVWSDVASLAGMPAHMSLYTTMYIKPALKVIMAQLSRLSSSLSDLNRAAVEVTGELMYPNAEPGGQQMFDFMRAVMRAGSVGDVPTIKGDVEEYFYDHREKFEEGSESDGARPRGGGCGRTSTRMPPSVGSSPTADACGRCSTAR